MAKVRIVQLQVEDRTKCWDWADIFSSHTQFPQNASHSHLSIP